MDGRHLARRVLEEGLLSSDVLFGEDTLPVVEGYEVERPIGRGGAGVVYLARDTTLQRHVALKFLHNAGPADVARLRREARFTARLDDPAILPVDALGEAEGRPYIAM